MTVSIPYMQSVLVPDKSLDEVYKTITTWLKYNNWGMTGGNQSTLIEARYNADIHMFQIGPKDNFPKNMEIRLSEREKDVIMEISITQEIIGMGNKGYLYWGIRLQDLYEMLGVSIDEKVLAELVPDVTLNQIINSRTRMMMATLFSSTVIGWLLWDYLGDLGLMYAIVFLGPILLLVGWDLQAYKSLHEKMRKRHKIK